MEPAARESSTYQRGSGGGGGGGRGGKIRKATYRNTQTTPYERPLTALRNSNISVKNTNGWLSRIVDPASKLITSSARKILSSVFNKRILPSTAPKQPASVDGVLQSANKHQGTNSMVHPMSEKNGEDVACGRTKLDIDEVSELEKILKQKRFTRYEIDRLTTLLRSRTVNGSIRDEEENASMKFANEQALKALTYTPQRDNIISFYRYTGFTPTQTTRHEVFDEDINSPLELAKAYMSSRTSKFSRSMSDSQGLSPNYWTPNIPFASKSLIKSSHMDSGLVSLSFGSPATTSNSGRLSHSRMHQPTSLKGSELRRVAYGEPSSSAYELAVDQQQVSSFKNTSLKRRSSVLQDQFGSIGPIRRVRQKLNLLNSKGVDAPARDSSSPNSGSRDKTEALADAPASTVDPAPTYLTEVTKQTEPRLDQLVSSQNESPSGQISDSTKGKSPLILASETMASQISRNLEKGESSGVKEDAQYNNTMDDSHDTSLYDAGYSAVEYGKACQNEQKMPDGFSSEKISDTEVLNNAPLAEATFCDEKTCAVQKKQAFRMCILEDFVDMDDDDETEGTVSGSISATLAPSVAVPLPIVSTDVSEVEKPSVFLPSRSSTMKGELSLGISDGLVVSEESNIFRDSVADASFGHAPDSKLQAYRFGSGPADVDRTSKPSESNEVNISSEASHLFSKPQADTVAATPVLETSSFFSFGDATSNKGSLFNGSSGSSLHPTVLNSNFISDTNQNNICATNSTSVGSRNGLTSLPIGSSANVLILSPRSHAENSTPQLSSNPDSVSAGSESKTSSDFISHVSSSNPFGAAASAISKIDTPVFGFNTSATSTALNSHPQESAASGFGSELAGVEKSTDGSGMAPRTSSSAPMTSLFGSMAPTVGSSDRDSSSAAAVTSFAAPSTSASATNASTNSLFGASLTTGTGTGFTFGASSTPGVTTADITNTSSLFGASSTPVTFGANSTSGPTAATTNNGFIFGASPTPASVSSSSVNCFGASSAPANTTTAGFSFEASSTSAPNSREAPFGASSTPATTSSGFSFGGSSTPATTSSAISFGGSSTPATTNSGFSFGGSLTPTATSTGFSFEAPSNPATISTGFSVLTTSTPATTSSGFSFGGSSTPATTSSGFSFGGSSTPSATSSGFPFGGSSTTAAVTPGVGNPFVMSSAPGAKTTSSGFSFGASSTIDATSDGATFPSGTSSSPTGATSSAFLFGASSTSTPGTSTIGFSSGSSSAHPVSTTSSPFMFGSSPSSGSSFGASSTPALISFGASSTPAATNNGSPFGFTSGSSAFPFNTGTANNTPAAQPLFGNSNPFGSTGAVNDNNQSSMEDSMAEDSVQATSPAFPIFGQPSANASSFGFTAPTPSGSSNSFQFGSQQNLSNPSPFQASGSLGGFSAGGSFSLGTSGDKSNRRIIKPKKGRRK
ncbi:unnamed protein product [Rhodiola kirilowii]